MTMTMYTIRRTHLYAIYKAVMDSEKTALIAEDPAKERRPSKIAQPHVKNTVFTGVFVYPFMRYSQFENGSAPSRAKAKDWRDAASTMLEPIMYWQMTMNAHTARQPFWPKLRKKICAMGCELSMIASRSVPMQNARETLIAGEIRHIEMSVMG